MPRKPSRTQIGRGFARANGAGQFVSLGAMVRPIHSGVVNRTRITYAKK
jgi:hypothetical protein